MMITDDDNDDYDNDSDDNDYDVEEVGELLLENMQRRYNRESEIESERKDKYRNIQKERETKK